MKRLIVIFALALLLVACQLPEPLPPTPTPENTLPHYLNVNPDLVFGECNETSWYDTIWGRVWLNQCTPFSYELYQKRTKIDGGIDTRTTVPIAIEYTGAAYSVLPGGRAGRIGYTSYLAAFDPGCYAVKMHGFLHVWGEPTDYGAGVLVGDVELQQKQLPPNGNYEFAWFWLAETKYLTTVTWFFQFAYGSATADSFATIDRLEIVPVTIAHCE
jgi:hypothetical protein